MATVTLNFEDTIKNNTDTHEYTFCSETNMKHLRKSIAQLNAGKGTVHELIETD